MCGGGTVTVTYNVTDKCYLTVVARSFTINKADAPTISCIADKIIQCNAAFNFDLPTATDGCGGNPNVTVVSTIINPDGSQTRTWQVEDRCGQKASCSQKISMATCSHIFPTQTTCCNYSTGTAAGLYNVCTTVSGPGTTGGTVTNAIPGVMFYYTNIVAPATHFTVEVKQTNDGDLNKLFQVQGYDKNNKQQMRIYTSSCESVSFVSSFISNGTGARYVVTGATPGATYIVSVKYNVKTIQGAVYSGADRVSTYTFASYINNSAVAADNSTGTIDAVSGCQDTTPLPLDCTLPSTIVKGSNDVVSINDNLGLSVVAYPNPYSSNFNLSVKTLNEDKIAVSIYDMLGRIVETRDVNPRETSEIKIGDHYPTGVYNVVVTQGEEVKTLRVIKR